MSIEFGEHLRALRKNMTKYTQDDMAKLLGISRSTYTYYETGKSEPGVENLHKLTTILRVDYTTILN